MGFHIETSLVAGGLCGISGMLPDLDSDSGIPIRESMGFAAGIVPMLLVDRFQSLNMPYDRLVLITAALYFLIRFAGASLLGRFTVHRGMFHSIPAALTFAGLAFLICGPASDVPVRYLKAGAVFFGVMSHLVLDELYSIEWKGGKWRIKRSFGTAVKLWGKNNWANFSAYSKLIVVGIMIAGEPSVMNYLEARYPRFAGDVQRLHDAQERLLGDVRQRASAEGDGSVIVNELGPSETESTTPRWPAPTNKRDIWPQTLDTLQTTPGGFTPNAGRANIGDAQPIYRADTSGFAPR